MGARLLTAAAALALASCGDNRQQQTDTGSTEDLATQNISANDITAIDAATGDDANMAADAEFNLVAPDAPSNEAEGNAAQSPANAQ